MASNNCLLLSQLYVVVLLGLCATTATASWAISGENNNIGWRSLMNHGDSSPLALIAIHMAVNLWNLHESGATRTVMALSQALGVWEKVHDGVNVMCVDLIVKLTPLDQPSVHQFGSITMYMGIPQGLPFDYESVAPNGFLASPILPVGWLP
ncbi:hypothetical protein AXF42_Ash015903 [Apostasia shenzhenica]|uniref:Uncharacterized protein n=1 Tax=Apostasia shenzhenica TaxID=1088818 RepID=A0A2I0AWC8_9ASPA|nr:hypothetical protein AXF42_Ash015903 [Apostasia shenzhenica]